MNTTIRYAGVEDVDVICAIEAKTFYDTYGQYNDPGNMEMYMKKSFSPQQIKEELKDVQSKFLLLFMDQQLTGYAKLKWGSVIPGCLEEPGNFLKFVS